MSPFEVRSLSDHEIVEMLVNLHPSDEAVAWLASVISDPAMVEGVSELRRRYAPTCAVPATPGGRQPHASSVRIDADRWRAALYRRRIPLCEVGPMMDPPRSSTWANVMANRGHAGYFALDDLACALGIHVEELIDEVGTDDERARLVVCV